MSLIFASGGAFDFLKDFGVEWGLLTGQLVSFVTMAVILYYFVLKPVIKSADSRRAEIEKGLKDSEEAHKKFIEAERTSSEKIAEAAREASELLSKARDDCKNMIDKASFDASKKAEEYRAKAELENVKERERIKVELKQELSDLLVKSTVKLIGDILSEEQKSKLSDLAARSISEDK